MCAQTHRFSCVLMLNLLCVLNEVIYTESCRIMWLFLRAFCVLPLSGIDNSCVKRVLVMGQTAFRKGESSSQTSYCYCGPFSPRTSTGTSA